MISLVQLRLLLATLHESFPCLSSKLPWLPRTEVSIPAIWVATERRCSANRGSSRKSSAFGRQQAVVCITITMQEGITWQQGIHHTTLC